MWTHGTNFQVYSIHLEGSFQHPGLEDYMGGVDTFWKRVPAALLVGLSATERSDLVPYWFDETFRTQVAAGTVVAAEDTGALIFALLRAGAAQGPAAAAASAISARPPDWDDYYMVGTWEPGVVHLASRPLVEAPIDRWATQHNADVAQEVKDLGYHRPYDDGWAGQVLADTRELINLIATAAAAGEAIIVKMSA